MKAGPAHLETDLNAMTLREAARRTSRSMTTLRRYIRSGRLRADTRQGRFGPEYVVSERELERAGLRTAPESELDAGGRPSAESRTALAARDRESVPLTLYQELQMKHEQLLVQYGMIRAAGLQVLQLRAELDDRQRSLEASDARLKAMSRQAAEETARLRAELRRAELDQEGQSLEIAALREKVRGLEMLTRNAVTSESIEKQFSALAEQSRRVARLTDEAAERVRDDPRTAFPPGREHIEPDH